MSKVDEYTKMLPDDNMEECPFLDHLYDRGHIVQETEELVVTKILEIEREVDKLPGNLKDAYFAALTQEIRQKTNYVRGRKLLLQFLRADSFDSAKAAKRLAEFFKYKLDLFGPEKLPHEITRQDLNENDMKVLEAGTIPFFVGKDCGGRMVVMYNRNRAQSLGFLNEHFQQSILRVGFYKTMCILEDEEVQKKGFVVIRWNVGGATQSLKDYRLVYRSNIKMYHYALPVKMAACHDCANNGITNMCLSWSISIMPASIRSRFNMHTFSTVAEYLSELSIYGINVNALPIGPNGEFKPEVLRNGLNGLSPLPASSCTSLMEAGDKYLPSSLTVCTVVEDCLSTVQGIPIKEILSTNNHVEPVDNHDLLGKQTEPDHLDFEDHLAEINDDDLMDIDHHLPDIDDDELSVGSLVDIHDDISNTHIISDDSSNLDETQFKFSKTTNDTAPQSQSYPFPIRSTLSIESYPNPNTCVSSSSAAACATLECTTSMSEPIVSRTKDCNVNREQNQMQLQLFEILESKRFEDAIWWSRGGKSFEIQKKIFSKTVLVKEFDGIMFNSFLRKLRNCGFRRVPIKGGKSPNILEYQHRMFQQNSPHLLKDWNSNEDDEQVSKKEKLPMTLKKILDSNSVQDAMWWECDGKAFAIECNKFPTDVLDHYFKGVKLGSFYRMLSRWGFKRMHDEEKRIGNVRVYQNTLFHSKSQLLPDLLENWSYLDGLSQMSTQTGKTFFKKLYKVISDERTNHAIWWDNDGTSIGIHPDNFKRDVLAQEYNGVGLYSFRRSLKRWGFENMKTKGSTLNFQHPYFKKDTSIDALQ